MDGTKDLALSDSEGTFLALVLRLQPVTAYQVSKVYAESPVSNFNTSKGKIYPLINRLAGRGLLAKRPVADDGRKTERLNCTLEGERAVRGWVKKVSEHHMLLEDPLRTKVQSFDLLTATERIEWVLAVKETLAAQLDGLDAYEEVAEVPYQDFVHDNAVRSVRARIAWLDKMLRDLIRTES